MGRYRVKKNGIPILSHMDISRIGGHLADSVHDPAVPLPEPTDLKTLLQRQFPAFTLITDQYLSPSGNLLGLTSFPGGEMVVPDPAHPGAARQITIPEKTIMIDRRLMQERLLAVCRFTLAHEMGHALFHGLFCADPENMKLYASQGSIARPSMLVDDGTCFQVVTDNHIRNEHDWLEWQANAFAAAVLLPERWVRRIAGKLQEDFGDEASGTADPGPAFLNELVIMLADIFAVSETTALIRLKTLGIAPQDSHFSDAGILV